MPLNLIFIQPGNYTIEDNGVPGDNISVIKDGAGAVIFTFAHPADALGFTVSTPGVNLTVNITDTLGAANFTIGSLTDPTATPDSVVMKHVHTTGTVTLVSNGAIIEGGGDAATDITAGAVVLSAGTGVGTGANAIETRTGLFEAETGTGGIAVSNIGAVQIGGVVAEVDGLDVVTSGDINFATVGSVFLTEANSVTAAEAVHGGGISGNVVLTATGFNSDIIGNVDNGAVSAPRGSIALSAGRDIQLGTIGADFNNDVIANNAVTFTAGRDILIDGFADILADNYGLNTGSNLTFTAGRNVGILNLAGTSASVTASGSGGGDAIITTGAGGSLTVNGPGSFALGSTSGDVIVNADRMLIDGASGISAPSGQVIIRPVSEGWETILGSASDVAFALELSDTELNRIFSPNLTIGSATGGSLTVASAISPAGAANLTLRSQADIFVSAGITTTESLRFFAGDSLFQTAGTLTTTTLLVQVDNAGDDAATGGATLFNGSVVATSIAVSGNADADALRGIENVDQFVHGNGGNDTINSSGEGQYFGDEGNDRIFAGLSSGAVPEALDGGAGIDTLDTTSYSGDYVINLATGTSNFSYESFVNFENVITGNGHDVITGTSAANGIQAGSGNDTINGGAGIDTMSGGLGDDWFYADNAGDVVVEAAGEGNDRVLASVSYVLGAAAQVEILSTTNNAGTTAINLTGNGFVNSIAGNNGANVLVGGGGADTLNGLGGDDFLYVDDAGDVIVEAASGGSDRVFASVNYVLGAAAEVEILSTTNNTGVGAINLTGNGFANSIAGNNGVNLLNGGAGADTLNGLGGDDMLYVDNAGDVVVEAAGGGSDRVFASVSYALGAAAQVEILSTTNNAGVGAINLTGNGFANSIAGNAGANVLDGLGGSDTLNGLGGADTFRFTTALGAGNVDTITGYVVADDVIHIDNAVFTGLAAGALAAGAFNTGAAATQADDRIIYNSATGALLFDADGNGAGAAVQFATLAAGLAMGAGEFVVI